MNALGRTCSVLSVFLVTACVDGEANTQDAQTEPMLSQLRSARSVLWVGAHPDDETTVAPLMAEACLGSRARCTFLVMTRGEAGGCKRPEGCLPDLATVRAQELRASAAIFGAELFHWDLGDGVAGTPEGVVAQWAARVGSEDVLVQQVEDVIATANPDILLTFDPRHGTTCHADHRAASAIALTAAARFALPPETVWLVESRFAAQCSNTGDLLSAGFAPMVPADPSLWTYDATQQIAGTVDTAWSYGVGVLSVHRSQFTPETVAAFEAAPPELSVILVTPAAMATSDDPLYLNLCPLAPSPCL